MVHPVHTCANKYFGLSKHDKFFSCNPLESLVCIIFFRKSQVSSLPSQVATMYSTLRRAFL